MTDTTGTTDPRLGRLEQFDERSRNYPLLAAAEADRPLRSMTWACPVFLNQGQEGACVEFGWLHRLLARTAIISPARATRIAYEHGIYFAAQRIDPYPGGAYPGAQPFTEGTSVLAGAQVAKTLGLIGGYRWAFGIQDVLTVLGYHSGLVLGVEWWSDMSRPKGDVITPAGQVVGGHCIYAEACSLVFAGTGRTFPSVDQARSYVTLHNSWGTGWGAGGRCRISVEHLAFLLDRRGEACSADRPTKAPT